MATQEAPIDTSAPLTRAELDRLTCQSPGCDHTHHEGLVLNSRCHTKQPTYVRYWGDGVLEVRCKIDNGFVASIALDAFSVERLNKGLPFPCADPNCTEPFEHHALVMSAAPCHKISPKAGVFVSYQDGQLQFFCSACRRQFEHVQVKERHDVPS